MIFCCFSRANNLKRFFRRESNLHENNFFPIFVQYQILTLISEIVTSFFWFPVVEALILQWFWQKNICLFSLGIIIIRNKTDLYGKKFKCYPDLFAPTNFTGVDKFLCRRQTFRVRKKWMFKTRVYVRSSKEVGKSLFATSLDLDTTRNIAFCSLLPKKDLKLCVSIKGFCN